MQESDSKFDQWRVKERSNEFLEFGVQNRSGHMNCFLNSALQLIWSLWLLDDIDSLKAFVGTPIEKGPELLRPLMTAITEFFQQVGLS